VTNADDGPAQVGAEITVPATSLGGDGVLSYEEVVSIDVELGVDEWDLACELVNPCFDGLIWAEPVPAAE
jgi:hypothetical protein